MSRLAVMSLDEVREYVEGGMYHEQDLVDLYEYARMLRYEQDCINVLGHEKIQALEQENTRLRAALAEIADQYVHDEGGIKLQGMACDALREASDDKQD